MEYKRFQEGVIKSILARPESVVEVINFVDSKDFEDVGFRMVFDSILELYLEKKPVSLPEIALKIGENGGSIDTGWLFNLESGISDWIQQAPPKTWAKLLKKESSKQKAIEVLKEGINEIAGGENDALGEMDIISKKLTEISVEATTSEEFNIKAAVDKFKEQSREIVETGGKIASISSAYPTIDYYTQGWAPTQLITVGARTGIGKSVFAINNAVAAMQQDKSVYFFSLEMTEREVISRIVASLAMIPILKIEKAHPLTDDETQRLNEALEFVANSKLIIDTNPTVTADYIKRASIRQAQTEEGLDFIIIDYLQLMKGSGKSRSRQEEVSEVSRDMKILAKELNVPVMVLVQLLREKRDEEDQVPKLYEIRESGAIAQDSNVVILIHRNKDRDSEMIDPVATFIIAKNRQGEDNKYITVRTRLESSLFIDENKKGQELLDGIEQSNMNNYEENMDSNAYLTGSDNDVLSAFADEDGAGFDSTPTQSVEFSNESYEAVTGESPLPSYASDDISEYDDEDFGLDSNEFGEDFFLGDDYE